MNLRLKRDKYQLDGIFSGLLTDDIAEDEVAIILEHAYDRDDPEVASAAGAYPNTPLIPKLTPGVFICRRGPHELEDGTKFETFEITGIPGHSGIVFHWGNFNKDSKGCPLMGDQEVIGYSPNSPPTEMITNSRKTFAKFMDLQAGLDSFILTVEA